MNYSRSLQLAVLLIFFTAQNAFAFEWADLWQRPDQRAHKLLESGDSAAAAGVFNDPQWRGISHYRSGEFDQAQKEFETLGGDTGLYNQGVTAVQQGDYTAAVEKFETLLEGSPDHKDAKHNLEIARELEKQKQQQQQQQQGDQGSPSGEEEQQQQDDQSGENSSESDGQSPQPDAEGDQQSGAEEEQRGGELDANPEDAQQNQQGSDNETAQQTDQPPESSQNGGAVEEPEATDDEQVQASAMPEAGPTEGEQATEQWLRRIPDDPSQLLRNKIKLNHMIEHADVQDMQEPW